MVDQPLDLAELAGVLIFVSHNDPFSTRTRFSNDWLEFLGVEEVELLDASWISFVHDDDRQGLVTSLRDASQHRSSYKVEYRMRRHDGEWRWMVERGQPRAGSGFTGVAADITEGRAAREAARSSELRFRGLVEYSTDVVWLVNRDNRVVYASPSSERVFGPVEAPFDDALVHPNDIDRLRRGLALAKERPGLWPTISALLRDKQELWRNYEVLINNALEDVYISGMVVTLRDVTERTQSRETIDRLNKQVTVARAEERQELAMALHDDTIQSLLAAQWSLSSLESVVSDAEIARQLEATRLALVGAINSARHLLLDARVPDFDETKLEEALTALGEEYGSSGMKITLAFDVTSLLNAKDCAVVFRICREGLQNIRKHSEASHVDIDVVQEANVITVEVRDNGVGIDTKFTDGRSVEGHYGLSSLKGQVANLGGEVVVSKLEPSGTVLRATWKLI